MGGEDLKEKRLLLEEGRKEAGWQRQMSSRQCSSSHFEPQSLAGIFGSH